MAPRVDACGCPLGYEGDGTAPALPPLHPRLSKNIKGQYRISNLFTFAYWFGCATIFYFWKKSAAVNHRPYLEVSIVALSVMIPTYIFLALNYFVYTTYDSTLKPAKNSDDEDDDDDDGDYADMAEVDAALDALYTEEERASGKQQLVRKLPVTPTAGAGASGDGEVGASKVAPPVPPRTYLNSPAYGKPADKIV